MKPKIRRLRITPFQQDGDEYLMLHDALGFAADAAVPRELARVFRCVHAALKPGGRLLFDLNDEGAFLRHWRGETFTVVEDDHACVTRGVYDAAERLGTVTVTLFRLMEGTWRRSDVVVHERCYPAGEVLVLLREAGFRAGMHRAEALGMDDQEGRMFFVANRDR